MSAKPEYDIIIIGAGFVGLTLALAIAKAGRRVAIIESHPLSTKTAQHSVDGRALALSSRSCEILNHLIAPLQMSCPIEQIEVSERGSFGKLHLRASEQALAALGYVIAAPELGAQLLHHAQAQKNIVWITPATVVGMKTDPHQITVQLKDSEQTLSAQLLIVAEGAHSWTRTQCHFETWTRDYEQMAMVANVNLTQDHANCAYQRFTHGATIALLPLSERRATVVVTVSLKDYPHWQDLSDADLLAKIQSLLGSKIGVLSKIGPRRAYPLQAVFVEKAYDGRVLLMGNAAHTLNPIAAQGLNLSLRDIELLVDLLSGADLNNASELMQLLAHYQQLRLPDQKNMLQLTDGLVKMVSRPTLKPLRSLGLLTLDILPFAKRRLYDYLLGV